MQCYVNLAAAQSVVRAFSLRALLNLTTLVSFDEVSTVDQNETPSVIA